MKKTDRCPVCGGNGPLSKVRMTSSIRDQGRGYEVSHLCAGCHAEMDRGTLREFEFVRVLLDLMRASGAFGEIEIDRAITNGRSGKALRPDIMARSADGSRVYLIECKSEMTLGHNRLADAISQLALYQEVIHADEVILALPARLTAEQRASVEKAGYHAWDLPEIAARFRNTLSRVSHPVLRPLLLAVAGLAETTAAPSAEARLLDELRALPPGHAHWVAYQKLISRIFERLFCPPLSPPITELPDEAGVNRRDIILPNYAENGFWAFVRNRYCADFIVADAKNYSSTVGKAEALQVLNYLKRHGAGLLGIIVTRIGPDDSCLCTVREYWSQEGKLVVILSDDHVERMLRAKEVGAPPEDVIRQWIEDFRLKL